MISSIGLNKQNKIINLNAIIQCFAHLKEITESILYSDNQNSFNQNSTNKLSKAYATILNNLFYPEKYNNTRGVYSISAFLDLIMANQRNATDSDFQDKVQIMTLNNNKNCKTINSSNNKTLTVSHKPKKKNKYCRICYMEEDDEIENPIIQPCHCSGSCKYIHLKCLKQWIKY